ncbi:MAG: hypothetical protein HQK77_14135 [Desulfobacterales bacterium]|nr:hypothetical protein [Desulfobacterales bacterium]
MQPLNFQFPRFQLFEFHERHECPKFLRDAIVEILGRTMRWGAFFDPVIPIFKEFCQKTDTHELIDLCSGTGESTSVLIDGMNRQGITDYKIIISDLFPKIHAMKETASHYPNQMEIIHHPIDATDVPQTFDRSARTIINAFHHFPEDLAKKIINDCVEKQRGIFILELFPRKLFRFLPTLPYFIASYVVTPFLTKHDRFLKIIFSFVIPIIALIGCWDAFISVLRIYTKDELMQLVKTEGYEWIYEEVPFFPCGKAVVFYGIPLEKG